MTLTAIKHVIIRSPAAFSSSEIPERVVSLTCPPWEKPDAEHTNKAVKLAQARKTVALDTERQRVKDKSGRD
jgi:hypothetical protein